MIGLLLTEGLVVGIALLAYVLRFRGAYDEHGVPVKD